MSNKIYYKVVKEHDHVLLNKDNPFVDYYRTEYTVGDWTFAKGNTRLFVFEKENVIQALNELKTHNNRVYKCHIGSKIVGNGVDYGHPYLLKELGTSYGSYDADKKVCSWFWDNVEKNLKAKKKYCKGIEEFLFTFDDVILTDKVKLLEEV